MVALCQCGCRNPAPIAKQSFSKRGIKKGEPFRFIRGHCHRGRSLSDDRKRTLSIYHTGKAGKAGIGAVISRSRTGKEPTYSPYIPNLIVRFKIRDNRWACSDPKNKKRTTTHAKAVYEYLIGSVPVGYHVHHKNGDPSKLEYDAPDNLVAVPSRWNNVYFPLLAKEFGFHESLITETYLNLVEEIDESELFKEVCRQLLIIRDGKER